LSAMIPYGKQDIREEDIEAVVSVLRSDFLTQGPVVPQFEAAVAAKVECSHAVAVNSATSALHLAVASLGLGPGDALWTSPISFVASANCARFCGAEVDFVDIDPNTFNMCPEALSLKLLEAKKNNCLPKVLIPVHMAGQSPEMLEIAKLARSYGVAIVEDASHAVGAHYSGRPVGSCSYSDITVFSFHPVKIITTAEGGIALTNDARLAEKMRLLRSHGISRDEENMTHAKEGFWYYQQLELGFNYRMTEIQAALGLSQLDRLDEYIARRNVLAAQYDRRLSALPLKLPLRQDGATSSFHLYIVRLVGRSRQEHRGVMNYLRDKQIGVNLHYIPIHLQPYYSRLGFAHGDFPRAENYYSTAISLPLYPGLKCDDLRQVVCALGEALI
jgi:UDP-4-amino-4,6-dideoxy-N-acetyl-beta-L-altrosamine transaminase